MVNREKGETVTDFLLLGFKITADDDCSLEIKSYDKHRQCIKKQRHYFANKRPPSQSYGCVRMWELNNKEGWVLKNWWFRIVMLVKTPESPLERKEIKPVSVLKEIDPEYSLEGLMLKLKLQYFGHLMQRADPLEKTLMLRKTEDDRGWDGQMASPIQWTWVWANSKR